MRIAEDLERIWQNQKEYGKNLYLQGSIQRDLKNFKTAQDLLLRARDEFHRYELRNHEALALDRLAGLLLESDLMPAADSAKHACEYWAEALRLANQIEARGVFNRLQEHVSRLTSLQMVPIVAGLLEDLKARDALIQTQDAVEKKAAERHWHERNLLGHWYVKTVRSILWDTRPQPLPVPEVLRDYSELLIALDWCRQDCSRSPARPTDDLDLGQLANESCKRVRDFLGKPLSVSLTEEAIIVRANRAYLGRALESLFHGAHTAFGSMQFRISKLPEKLEEHELRAVAPSLSLAEPKPEGMELAKRLVQLDYAWDDETVRKFFGRGYTGHLTLAAFLIQVACWGNLTFDPAMDSILVTLPGGDCRQ